MSRCYRVAEIRAAEYPYLAAQSRDDELMRHAASAVAEVAGQMLGEGSAKHKVLLLVGSGGNGGDALYAGRELSSAGASVDAVLLGSKPHARALAAFQHAGGRVLPLSEIHRAVGGYDLVIDGIVGIGGHGPLRPAAGRLVHEIDANAVPVLAVDVPSGVEADTGRTFAPAESADATDSMESAESANPMTPQRASAHVTAAVTVTFGGLRYAHAISPACGRVVLRDIALDHVSEELPGLGRTLYDNAQAQGLPQVTFYNALADDAGKADAVGCPVDLEPGATDHKYSAGVVGIAAGSEAYPGAGQLCATSAVRATSPAVIYVGDVAARARITAALPTVIARPDTERRAEVRVDAWVVGPGRGTDSTAADELRDILATDADVIIDADALTVLANHEDIRELVRKRGHAGQSRRTVLTPHAGEFERITGHPVTSPIDDATALAEDLHCEVLLKGRRTVIADGTGNSAAVIDAGSSWAATPGSGDVLAGLVGAWVARGSRAHSGEHDQQGQQRQHAHAVRDAVIIHARAAFLAAQTEYGPAPCSAQDIAESIRRATAWFTHGADSGKIRL